MTRSDAISAAQSTLDSGDFVAELARLVAIPTESQHPRGAPALARYLEEAMRPRLEALGFACRIVANPIEGAGPFLIAERREGDDLPTVLTYGHGDTVMAQEDRWREGLSPWVLTEEGDRLYGRGTADNKGQHLVNLTALEAVLAARGRLGFNIRVVIETGEETGSPGLGALFRAEREALTADVLIASDGPRLGADRPTLFFGARGGVTMDLSVDLREGAHHSGNWGGLLADPGLILAHALACVTDANGAIRIPEWRPDSLSNSVRAALADLEIEAPAEGPAIDAGWGEPGLTAAEKVFGWNSFCVLAYVCGEPERPVNAIQPRASARVQLRFVVGTDRDDVAPALRRWFDAHGFDMVEVRETERNHFTATRLDPDDPWAQWAAASVARTTGRRPALLPNLGGSLPNEEFAHVLGMPTIWVPHSYAGCSQHAPDEHALKPILREGLGMMAGLWWDLGEPGVPGR
ncbi:M20 family metallopeptidase [Rubrimonas cliftonensis]|uniref:Acetylornithine deacetylase/Succinyl-diaminopimelate desuccinylase n=1 Tax=Rubrimonas cliftonensis TaxID=89524 RepID=A0A1H4DZA4_9RHOB|nr:M20 family metallopeptidase [Rubrimonas cliftonensis]SEA78135.1 Acetylornithine deacetylase/Succinyl-diaminopimelate desuccinylase [Rubrimonas cliftonensis]